MIALITNTNLYFYRKFHMLESNVYFQKTFRLLLVSYLHTNVPHRHHVLGLILDSARSCPSKSDTRCHKSSDAFNPTCQKFIFAATCILHQSYRYFHGFLHNICFPVTDGIRASKCVVGRMCSIEAKTEIDMSQIWRITEWVWYSGNKIQCYSIIF